MDKSSATSQISAIVSADLVNYCRLMELDESRTLRALKFIHRGIICPLVALHEGRLVKTMGDDFLMEFAKPIAAVDFSIDLQLAMLEQPYDDFSFRIGISCGQVRRHGRDIFGHVVNLASRLEEIASPGDVWLTKSVQDQIAGQHDIALDDLGEYVVRHISQPIHIFRISRLLRRTVDHPTDPASRPAPGTMSTDAVSRAASLRGDHRAIALI